MNRLKVFLNYPDKKSFFTIIKEVIILIFKKKEIPFYYFKYLYRKDASNFLDHLSLKEQRKLQFHKNLHNPDYFSLNNKLFFSLLFKDSLIDIPKFIGHNFKSTFFYKGNTFKTPNIESFIDLFEKLFKEEKVEGIFIRPPSDYGGKDCFKININNYREALKQYYTVLTNGNFVYTKVIEQHSLINQIHSKSINTLRIVTLITSYGTTEIVSAFMRFGVGDSVVDNASSGGFFVGINLEQGTLKAIGHYLPEYGGKQIHQHPNSNFKFDGFKIPYFKEARDIVIKAREFIPNRLIGWDVAITPNGPVIIESNARPHLQMSNIVSGGLLKNKHVKKALEELN